MFFGHCIDQLDELDGESWIGPSGADQGKVGIDGNISAELREDAELVRCVVTAEEYHAPMCAIAARYIGRGMPLTTVEGILRGLMLSHPELTRDDRWESRYEDIPSLVKSAVSEYGGEQVKNRRSIARITHCMAEEERPPDDIRAAVLGEAARIGLPSEVAIRIASGILRDRAEAAHA